MGATNRFRQVVALLLMGLVSILFAGCQTHPLVLAATGTMLGVEVSQNPATQCPQAKIGYNRAEFVVVNRKSADPPPQGQTPQTTTTPPAKTAQDQPEPPGDVPNVLMEFGYGGTTPNSIYQRLAVGSKAVTQSIASGMFLKDASGSINPQTAETVKKAYEAMKPPAKPDSTPK